MFDTQGLDNPVLIKIGSPVTLDKNTTISVPLQYKAFLVVNNKVLCRVNPCSEQNVMQLCGKSYKGQQISIIYVAANTNSFQAGWGFGNVQVNNERLKEAYVAGANGKFSIDITEPLVLMKAFPGSDTITLQEVREPIVTLFKTIGTSLLGEYFANTKISVFEISACVQEFRDKLFDILKKESLFENLGIELSMVSVNGFHINEDDLNMIRERINNG